MAVANAPLISFDEDDASLPPSYGAVIDVTPFKASDYVKDGKTHVLLAATGSLATDTLGKVIDELRKERNISIRVVLSTIAASYISAATLLEKDHVEAVYTDADWAEHQQKSNSPNAFLNYELRTWLDFMLVVPCSANTMSSMAHGMSVDLVTSIVQIFDRDGRLNPAGRVGRCKYLAVAPALDSVTWNQPAVRDNIETLRIRWVYQRLFLASGEKRKVSWCVVCLQKENEKGDKTFNHLEDNCDMQLDPIMGEIRWELSKFWDNHPMYAPGK